MGLGYMDMDENRNRNRNRNEIREFMQERKRKKEQQRLQMKQKAKEKAEQLMQNLRELYAKTNSCKKGTISKFTSKASKIKQLISRKQAQILGKYGFTGFNYHVAHRLQTSEKIMIRFR